MKRLLILTVDLDLEEILKESLERRQRRNERALHEDFDEEEMEALEEEQAAEDEVFDQFSECVGTLLKSFKSNILADIEPLLQSKIAPMFVPERSAEERRIAICIFDDVFEHASQGGATLRYLPGFSDACVRGSSDADADVRQASVYGYVFEFFLLISFFFPYANDDNHGFPFLIHENGSSC